MRDIKGEGLGCVLLTLPVWVVVSGRVFAFASGSVGIRRGKLFCKERAIRGDESKCKSFIMVTETFSVTQ